MADSINWTPTGCGAAALGLDPQGRDSFPEFPCDIVSRSKHLDLGVEPVFLAWEIARLAGEEISPAQHRALMFLILAAQVVAAEGSTRLPLASGGHLDRALKEFKTTESERAAVCELLVEAQKIGNKTNNTGLSAVIGGPEDYRPLIIDHGCLYIQKLHVLESSVGRRLRERIGGEAASIDAAPYEEIPETTIETAMHDIFEHPPIGPFGKIELDSGQKEAVRAALSGRIAIISGRPGSGKTSIVASVLRVLARIDAPTLESTALAAPTGKAADRMRQSIAGHLRAIPEPGEADQRLAEACPPSSTLHRLLGYSPNRDRFWHNEDNPLAEKLVIVDESSMIDLAMMDRLLRALQAESRIVFLGDADQLPSIEAGAVMRDLCQSGTAIERGRVIVLGKSYRAREEDSSGKRILEVAGAINNGMSPKAAGNGKAVEARKEVSELLFEGVEHLLPGGETQRAVFFTNWLQRIRALKPGLDKCLSSEYVSGPSGFDDQATEALRIILSHYERFRILCATRVAAGGTGTEAVNAWFHRRWVESLRGAGLAETNRQFLVGEPVMVTRNDYALRLYNGDSGLVLKVTVSDGTRNRRAEPMAIFPRSGGFVAYPLGALRGRLELAWATTVHKAQGSEYDHVAIMLPEVHVRPLTRELLYTAITRARRAVVIIGSEEVLESGVKRTMGRASGLADMLG